MYLDTYNNMCMCSVCCGKNSKQASLCFLFHILEVMFSVTSPKRLYLDYAPGNPG